MIRQGYLYIIVSCVLMVSVIALYTHIGYCIDPKVNKEQGFDAELILQKFHHHFANKNVADFVELAGSHNIHLILLDPVLLRHIPQPDLLQLSPSDQTLSKLLNQSTHNIVFGLSSQHEKHIDQLLTELQQNGTEIWKNAETDPNILRYLHLEDREKIYTHYLLSWGICKIHLAILHDRQTKAWWIGQFQQGAVAVNDSKFTESSEMFSKHHALYNRFDTVNVTEYFSVPRFPGEFLTEMLHSKFIPCNYTGAELFYQKYPKGDVPVGFEKLLSAAARALDYIKVPFTISEGTLLGWCRQCDFINYTNDVDITIPAEYYNDSVVTALIKEGLYIMEISGLVNDSLRFHFGASFADGKFLDVCLLYEDEDMFWSGVHYGHKLRYTFPKSATCWTEFYGIKLRIPCQVEAYLEVGYGPDWMILESRWDWKSSGKDIIRGGKVTEDEQQQAESLSKYLHALEANVSHV